MRVTICDVGPRDGLQNEAEIFGPGTRAALIDRLSAAGLPRIEAVSFVRPDLVPQMAGAEEVVAGIDRADGVEYSGLVLNREGYERFAQTPLDRVNCPLAATETFNRRNGNASLDEALARVLTILERSERPTTVTISVAFGCPFEGPVDPGIVADLAARLRARADEVVLADTIGVATPGQVRSLVERVRPAGVHLHNTRNTGFANAYAALEGGVRLFDASVAGLRQHLGRVGAERRRRPAVGDAPAVDRERRRDGRVRPEVLEQAERRRLLVPGDLADVLDGRRPDAGLGAPPDPRVARLGREPCCEQRDELLAVRHARPVRREALVVGELGKAERAAERREEAVVRRRDHQLAVGRGEGLVGDDGRVGRAVPAGDLAGREIAREVVRQEAGRRLVQRDLDDAPT